MPNRSLSKIWVVVVLIIVVVGIGIFAWQYFGVPTEKVKDETAKWQTYRNEEYDFEVKYPEKWPNPEEFKEAKKVEFSSEDYQRKIINNVPFELISGMSVTIEEFQKVPTDITWQEFVEGKIIGYIVSQEFVSIEGKEVYKTTLEDPTTTEYTEIIQFPSQGGTIFDLSFTALKKDREKSLKIFNQMFSTFRFLESVKSSEEVRISMPDINSFDLINKTFEALNFERQKIKILTSDSTKIYRTINFENPNWENTYYTFPEFYSLIKNWAGLSWWFIVRGVYENEKTIKADEIFYYVQ